MLVEAGVVVPVLVRRDQQVDAAARRLGDVRDDALHERCRHSRRRAVLRRRGGGSAEGRAARRISRHLRG